MKHDLKTYLIIFAVFALSFGSAYFVTSNKYLEAVIAAPGVLALLSALFQLIRDQAAHEKQLEIQNRQFQFTLGAASHMANTAFDRHVEFCEKYMTEIHQVMHTLFREAETPEALVHAGKFHSLREEHAVWLTDEINQNLGKFESAIRKLGANARFIETTIGHERYAEQRSIRIDKSHELFMEILGIDETQEVNEEYAIEAIKKKVRAILGVEELTKLRGHLVTQASHLVDGT